MSEGSQDKPAGNAGGAEKPAAKGSRSGGSRRRNRSTTQRREPAAAPAAETGAARSTTGAGASLWLALVALVLAIGVAVGGYFIWHEVNRQAAWQQEVLAQIDSRNAALDARLKSFDDRLQADLAATRRAQDALQQRLAAAESARKGLEQAITLLRAQLGRGRDDWVLAEAGYLLNVAHQRAALARDPATAILALQTADQRLQALADPGLKPVRDQIARDITALQAVQLPDIDGLTSRLEGLEAAVDGLKLAGAHYQPPAPQGPGEGGLPSDWKQVPGAVWDELRKLVVVRRNDQPVGPMLAPEQQYFLHENLRLQLAAARLALLRGEPAAWQGALQTARDWLQRHFDVEAPAVKATLDAVDDLMQVEVRPAIPDVSGSLRRLREVMRLRELAAEAPAGGAETGSAQP
ncbi:uroporphyrinogen-III C-methyltransferase [Thiohalobacter sp.]|uniref:uroporphyrinogen-III C-methyltransferase n=1 Tax=Thiohalobacter sp. TaxID=2025948 RepID=UPI00261F8EFE|nr:uroporphyrinogen-III C-methyltransferase [Thiohalobacter sp.]